MEARLWEIIELERIDLVVLFPEGRVSDVQRRMIPAAPPTISGLDMASVYIPCYTLGGDFGGFSGGGGGFGGGGGGFGGGGGSFGN